MARRGGLPLKARAKAQTIFFVVLNLQGVGGDPSQGPLLDRMLFDRLNSNQAETEAETEAPDGAVDNTKPESTSGHHTTEAEGKRPNGRACRVLVHRQPMRTTCINVLRRLRGAQGDHVF